MREGEEEKSWGNKRKGEKMKTEERRKHERKENEEKGRRWRRKGDKRRGETRKRKREESRTVIGEEVRRGRSCSSDTTSVTSRLKCLCDLWLQDEQRRLNHTWSNVFAVITLLLLFLEDFQTHYTKNSLFKVKLTANPLQQSVAGCKNWAQT